MDLDAGIAGGRWVLGQRKEAIRLGLRLGVPGNCSVRPDALDGVWRWGNKRPRKPRNASGKLLSYDQSDIHVWRDDSSAQPKLELDRELRNGCQCRQAIECSYPP